MVDLVNEDVHVFGCVFTLILLRQIEYGGQCKDTKMRGFWQKNDVRIKAVRRVARPPKSRSDRQTLFPGILVANEDEMGLKLIYKFFLG